MRDYDAGGWATGPTAYDEITRDAMSAMVEGELAVSSFPVLARRPSRYRRYTSPDDVFASFSLLR